MEQKISNQDWQQYQAYMEGFFGKTRANNVPRVEYKPQFIVQLLEMPSEHHKNELQKVSD